MTEPKPGVDAKTGTAFVGHEWDGIQELDTPMPRWWLITLIATIIFSIGYVIAYPSIPLLDHATSGAFGWSSRGQLRSEMAVDARARAGVLAAIAQTPVEALPNNAPLMKAAVEGGRAAFRVNCVQCHGSGAAGSVGYPNLDDDDWLWGGDIKTIHQTLLHGVRQPDDDATRFSQMPAFGHDAILTPEQVQQAASYVRVISGQDRPDASSQAGAALFAVNCVACHGSAGKGGRQFGAPNLTDAIWLYGGSREAIAKTITNAHAGVMPAWGQRLDPVTLKMLAAYVWSLGGGERPAAAPALKKGPDVASR
jgi:cytochrome c oxidase cbb3-type subunit III